MCLFHPIGIVHADWWWLNLFAHCTDYVAHFERGYFLVPKKERTCAFSGLWPLRMGKLIITFIIIVWLFFTAKFQNYSRSACFGLITKMAYLISSCHGLDACVTGTSFSAVGEVGVRFSGPEEVLEAGDAPGWGAVVGLLLVVRLRGANGGPLPEAFDISGLMPTGIPLWANVAPKVRWYDSSRDTSGEPGVKCGP